MHLKLRAYALFHEVHILHIKIMLIKKLNIQFSPLTNMVLSYISFHLQNLSRKPINRKKWGGVRRDNKYQALKLNCIQQP